MQPNLTRPFLEPLEDRAVPAVVGPVPTTDPVAANPAQAAPVLPPQPQTQPDPVLPGTPPTQAGPVTPFPSTQPTNGAVATTPAQNPGQLILLSTQDQNPFSNTREPAPG